MQLCCKKKEVFGTCPNFSQGNDLATVIPTINLGYGTTLHKSFSNGISLNVFSPFFSVDGRYIRNGTIFMRIRLREKLKFSLLSYECERVLSLIDVTYKLICKVPFDFNQ
jgi:hypothetical protein